MTSTGLSAMSLPVSVIQAAEAIDSVAVANCMPFVDSECAALGPDVLRVLSVQQSWNIVADFTCLSASFLDPRPIHQEHATLVQHERAERFMTWLEHSAPHRPHTCDDFIWTDVELQNISQSDLETIGTMKTLSSVSHSGMIETEAKLNPMKPGTPPSDIKAQLPSKSIMTVSMAHAVFLTLHEILLALPEQIGIVLFSYFVGKLFEGVVTADARTLDSAIQESMVMRNLERRDLQEIGQVKESASTVAVAKTTLNNHSSAFLTQSFANFLMKELQQWNGAFENHAWKQPI
jgi:hypothetical protein